EVEKLPFVVTSVERGERRRKAPAPFTTSTVQQEAAKQLGFSAGRTMRAAQKLYEGVELGDQGSVGLITYMRTASVRVPAAATKVDFDLANGRFLFRATGSRVLFDGYHALFSEAHEAEDAKTLDSLEPIPPLKEGDRATLKQVAPSQHFTEPPPRYSEASLVKELERLGIGRPSTYAAIISTLRTRWYATAKDRRFQPTPQGETVWKVLKRSFPEVFD